MVIVHQINLHIYIQLCVFGHLRMEHSRSGNQKKMSV
jgi:hypothetical protein